MQYNPDILALDFDSSYRSRMFQSLEKHREEYRKWALNEETEMKIISRVQPPPKSTLFDTLASDEDVIRSKLRFLQLFFAAKQEGRMNELADRMQREIEQIQKTEGPVRAMQYLELVEECRRLSERCDSIPQSYEMEVVPIGDDYFAEVVRVET